MKKVILPILIAFGLFTGTATAATVTIQPFDILTIGDGITPNVDGSESDGREYAASTDSTLTGGTDLAVSHWVGLDVILDGVTSTITSEDQSQPGGATTNLNIEIYNAIDNLDGTWTTVGAAFEQALPSPMLVGLDTGLYLVNIWGDLEAGLTDLTHNYGVRLTSVIPVPAAVWLFGTAMVGLFGLRRKNKMPATA